MCGINVHGIAIPVNTLCFRVTRKCNLHCPFCQSPQVAASDMTFEEVRSSLYRLSTAGLRSIKLTGGEPLLRLDLTAILQTCRDYGVEPTLCTNGVLLTRTYVELLQRLNAKVKISLHGMDGRHDTMVGAQVEDIIRRNISLLLSSGVRTSLHVLITSQNLHGLDELGLYVHSVGMSKVSFIAFVPRGRGSQAASAFGVDLDEAREFICRFRTKWSMIDVRWLDFSAKPYYVLEHDGSMWIQRGNEAEDTLLLGNINANS